MANVGRGPDGYVYTGRGNAFPPSFMPANSGGLSYPSFLAHLDTTVPNVTGDGTNYLVVFDSETFDTTSNFNTSTGIFTAPVTGFYQLNATVAVDIVSGTAEIQLITTQAVYYGSSSGPVGTPISINISQLINLTAGDVAGIAVIVSGGGLFTSVLGSSSAFRTSFSGILIRSF